MNRQEHLLTVVMEECNEVAQRASKVKRFGMDQIQQARDDKPEQNPERLTNRQRLMDEFYDLVATMEMAGLLFTVEMADNETCAIYGIPLDAIRAKQNKIEHYLNMSRDNGTLTD